MLVVLVKVKVFDVMIVLLLMGCCWLMVVSSVNSIDLITKGV